MHNYKNRAQLYAGLEVLEDRTLLTGGFTGGGLLGDYYATDVLPAIGTTPAFARTDARIDLNFAANQAPGGSSDPAFASVASTDYSVRWTGQVIPQYGETYQFYLTADAGARLSIRPTGTSNYTALFDTLGSTNPIAANVSYSFTAGVSYDVMVEYDHFTGPANIKLEWSSPSTPRATIEENQPLGINVGAALSYPASERYFADAIKSARSYWEMPNPDGSGGQVVANSNAQGWPTEDAGLYVWEGATDNQGTYLLSFKGQATVTAGFGTFVVGGSSYANSLPIGAAGAYNAATDTTTAEFVVPPGNSTTNLFLQFTNTVQQTATGTSTGVSNVSLMRPTSVGSSTPYAAGTLFTTAYLNALAPFQTIRTHEASRTNDNPVVTWAERDTPTSWFSQNYVAYSGGPTTDYVQPYNTDGVAWEYLVALANESGKDLYINIPEGADAEYITNLANLIKYGSDGTNPYTAYQANPVWKPLDPNLRVYIEYSNEVWNTVYDQYSQNLAAAKAAVLGNTSEGAILNYDHLPDNSQDEYVWAMRRVAEQIHNISATFQSVFGSSAMLNTVRPVLEWFNDNQQSTARIMLSFLDNYYDNGDGTAHVATPEPISSYIWGGGAAGYYDGSNSEGTQSATAFADAGFENVPVNASTGTLVDPANAGWTFTGNGGITTTGVNGAPAAVEGNQFAYLAPGSSISQSVDFSQPGTYGLAFQAASTGRFDIYVDGTLMAVEFPYGSAFTPQSTTYRSDSIPGYFTVATPGYHTITITADSSNTTTEYLDAIQITSSAAIFSGTVPVSTPDVDADYFPYPGTGISEASYQRDLALQVNWAKAYGLNQITYESGWSLGEADMSGVQYWAKFRDPNSNQTAAAETEAIDDYDAAGGSLLILGSFPQWEDVNSASTAPLVLGATASESTLAPTPTNGFAYVAGQPLVLTPASVSLQPNNLTVDNSKPGYATNAPTTIAAGADNNFLSWNVILPAAQSTQNYAVAVAVAGSGSYQLWIDNTLLETETVSGAGTFTATASLAPGLHGVRLVATSTTPLTLTGVTLTAEAAVALPPAAPSNFLVSAVASTSVGLKWTDNATNETGYRLEASTAYGFGTVAATVNLPANSTAGTITGLLPNTIYYFRITAINAAGSAAAPIIAAQTPAAAVPLPAPPTNVRVTRSSNSTLTLTWTDNATSETGYTLQASTDNFATTAAVVNLPANSTSGTIAGLRAGTNYSLKVTVIGRGGSSSATLTAATPGVVPPSAPTHLVATAVGTSSVTMGWTNTGTGATAMLLETSLYYDFHALAVPAQSPAAGSTSAVVSGLQPNTVYFFRLTASNSAGSAVAPLGAAETESAAPANLAAAIVGYTGATLNWSNGANYGSNTAVRIQVSLVPNFGSLVATVTAATGSSSASISGLLPQTHYYFRIEADNGAGVDISPAISAVTL